MASEPPGGFSEADVAKGFNEVFAKTCGGDSRKPFRRNSPHNPMSFALGKLYLCGGDV
jgi:hypothetical protein